MQSDETEEDTQLPDGNIRRAHFLFSFRVDAEKLPWNLYVA